MNKQTWTILFEPFPEPTIKLFTLGDGAMTMRGCYHLPIGAMVTQVSEEQSCLCVI